MYYYPSEDGFTQETFIELGALSRFFPWMEPRDDVEPQPVTLATLELGGEWVRSESNNDPNDGMRIRVDADRALLTFVPATVGSPWMEGRVLWREIRSDGQLYVLGSDGNYYPSRLTPQGEDRLTLSIGHGGAGNDQTWVRAISPAATRCTWSVSGASERADVWTTASTTMPPGLLEAFREVKRAGTAIQTLALTPDDEWVVVAANRPCYSAGFPSDVREWIDGYIASGREIDVVAFSSDGKWIVLAEDWMRRNNIPDAVAERIRQVQDAGDRIRSFAFVPAKTLSTTAATVFVTDRGDVVSVGVVPEAFTEAVAAASVGRHAVHEAAFGSDGGWALLAEDWFVTGGAPGSLIRDLNRYRTDEGRRIDQVVLDLRRGGDRWAVVSNRPEPPPDSTDLIDRVEHGQPGDSTIYQLMRQHGITGLSIALVENNEVSWARGYGLRQFDQPESYVHPATLFDAASISKPITYAAALQLVDSGDLDLTEAGILFDLVGNGLPTTARASLEDLRGDEISLAHLLSHCAGIDHANGSSGAQALKVGNALPSFTQMFYGQSPAAAGNRIVKVDSVEVGEMVDYSGANSLLVQGLLEHHADGGYDGHMRRFLVALEMSRSSFETNPYFWREIVRQGAFADGHWTDSTRTTTTKAVVEVYPNLAAAGLRTTATDLAQFVIMLNQSGTYGGRRLLNNSTVDRFLGRDGVWGLGVREMACGSTNNMQLGIRARGQTTPDEVFWHRGTHNGFRAYIHGFPSFEDASNQPLPSGLVMLMTGRGGDATRFADELKPRFRAVYGWPDYSND